MQPEKFIRTYPASKSRSLRAGLTVEAALCLPLILFMGVSLTLPVKMMDEKRRIQNSVEACAKDMAIAAYVEDLISDSGFFNEEGEASEAAQALKGIETESSKVRILASLDLEKLSSPVFEKAEVGEDDMIDFLVSYRMKMPFEVLGIEDIAMETRARRRAWTGSEGGRGRDKYGGNGGEGSEPGEEDRDNITVYVGKTSTRYHLDRNCHYLSNKPEAVDASIVDTIRNDSGGRYHACESCKPSGEGTVYIMSSGTAYHSSEDCKAIVAYVEEVKLKDVEHMGACSYCSKGM